jgi:large conductance mechanosensitive channel
LKKYVDEFKEFINKGDVVTVAIGLVMALYFKAIVDAILDGLVTPIIAAIFGEPDIFNMGFTINGATFSIGLVINAIINFVVVAAILFVIVKAYNDFKRTAPEAPAEPSPEITVLTEIRDELRAGRTPPR